MSQTRKRIKVDKGDGGKIIELKYSIPVIKEGGGSVDISQLVIGRLKAKHLKALPDNFMENKGNLNPSDMIPLLASITDLSQETIEELDFEDLANVAEELGSFLSQSLDLVGKK